MTMMTILKWTTKSITHQQSTQIIIKSYHNLYIVHQLSWEDKLMSGKYNDN